MLVYEKKLILNGEACTFKYKVITGEISCYHDDFYFFKKFLWLPYKKFDIKIFEDEYTLKTMLFPINKVSLMKCDNVICSDLFPRLKRYTVISFTLSSIKK